MHEQKSAVCSDRELCSSMPQQRQTNKYSLATVKKTLVVISHAQIGYLLLLFIVMSGKLQAETSEFFSWYGPCFRLL